MSLPFYDQAAERQAALPPVRQEDGLLFGIGMLGIILAIFGSAFLIGWGLANKAQIPAVPWYIGWGAFFAGLGLAFPFMALYHYRSWRRGRRNRGLLQHGQS